MARPAGRTRSDVKTPIRERWAPASHTPGPSPAHAPWAPRTQENLRLQPQLGTPGHKLPGVPDIAPAPSLRLLPSSRSRKRPGQIGPLQIRRCPNKGCSGGGSFLLLIWSFRLATRCSRASSPLPGFKPGARMRRELGTPRRGGLRRGALGASWLRRLAGREWAGEARPGAGARASRAGVLPASSNARPPTSGTVGAEREIRGGAVGLTGAEAAQERRGLDPESRR